PTWVHSPPCFLLFPYTTLFRSRDSSKETIVAAWVFLIASSVIFGLAHAPGWGLWKVIPAMVAGLGFGYLFLRHGIAAAIPCRRKDRKSTRPNSSHVSISYAVFC